MNKAKFFSILNECRANVSANVYVQGRNGGKTALVLNQYGAPNAFLSLHKDGSAAFEKAFSSYVKWLSQYFMEFNAAIEIAHTEALEMNMTITPPMATAKKTVLGKVISGVTDKPGSYGRFHVGRPVSSINIECAKRYCLGWLSLADMKYGCYSIASFARS
ncbi:hypothetical protein [Serratia sp. BIGb0163]|uniref:hypothetical protein n=1 Tax=Serratia sp. BIGb0163 TaxID=2940613 RepID=UPI002166F932|nr:hypothetical protein [Serratia sp. BIGb0163]MCS4264983.1 hypothetical protein [Serratia sp. BIGb0163]